VKVLSLEMFYALVGGFLALVALRVLRDRSVPGRGFAALFWGLLAITFLFARALPPVLVGYLVLAMVVLAAARQVRPQRVELQPRTVRQTEADRLGNRLFWPTLAIPATALAGSLLLGRMRFGDVRLVDPKQATLIALGLGALLALGLAWRVTGAGLRTPLAEGSRLAQTIGWALILPQLLAALGGVFAQAGVGELVSELVTRILPVRTPWVAVAAYCVGMWLFTVLLGNAFAAFAVVTAGIGLPLVVRLHGGNPAIMAAMGMLAGYCGTLMTPMAANFNLVPALLLELRDRQAVIKAQVPLGVAIFLANLALMYLCVFRF
jgi:uncharacterized membrane protein